jgi:hypothetical protein
MDYQEFDSIKAKAHPGMFGGRGRPKKDNTALILSALVVGMVILILLSAALNLVDLKNPFGITGNSVLDVGKKSPSSAAKNAEVKTIKNINFAAEVYGESFEVPADNLDVTVAAKEVQIISPTMDIVVSLPKPMVMEGFTGRMYWKDSMFILEGKLGKYLGDAVKINWKSDENIKIRVLAGSVETPQVNIPLFETIATGKVELADKVSLTPAKDLLSLDYYRGSFKAMIEDTQAKVIMKGTVEDITLGNEQITFNVG